MGVNLTGRCSIIYSRAYKEIHELCEADKQRVARFITNMQNCFKEKNKTRKLTVMDWCTFIDAAVVEAEYHAKYLKSLSEKAAYKDKVKKEHSECPVNWRRVQSQVNWIGNFCGHRVSYHAVNELPPLTPEFSQAIAEYNLAVDKLQKEARRQSLLFVDIRKEILDSDK